MASANQTPPTILIVGAGLGGIMLGALLEKADIPYTIFERATSVKPLGSALSISGTLLPAFEQLGLIDEFVAMGKYLSHSYLVKEPSFEIAATRHFSLFKELSGYPGYIVSRPLLYDLLLKQIPSQKIHTNKRVLNVSEEEEKVTVQTADGCVYTGDILVGADGAYSAVRQRLYERLKADGTLPKSDQEELPFSCTCLVGQTEELDFEDFPQLKEPLTPYYTTLGDDKPYTWTLFSTAQKTICWMVIHHLDKTTSKAAQEQRFRNSDNSEWGPHAAQSMCDETRDFPIPIGSGKTLGDMYDRTPKELISKVMLEEKVFTTWFSGRTVLLGDACHKLHPAGGQGAMTSMQDAIALANLIYALPYNTSEDIQKAFTEYQDERLPPVMEAYKSSVTLARTLEKGLGGAVALWVSSHMPQWFWTNFWSKWLANRSQVGFLKQIENKGTVPPNVSPSTEKARAVYEGRKGEVSI